MNLKDTLTGQYSMYHTYYSMKSQVQFPSYSNIQIPYSSIISLKILQVFDHKAKRNDIFKTEGTFLTVSRMYVVKLYKSTEVHIKYVTVTKQQHT